MDDFDKKYAAYVAEREHQEYIENMATSEYANAHLRILWRAKKYEEFSEIRAKMEELGVEITVREDGKSIQKKEQILVRPEKTTVEIVGQETTPETVPFKDILAVVAFFLLIAIEVCAIIKNFKRKRSR